MKRIIIVLTILVCTIYFQGCVKQPQENPKSITICAAASLKDALNEIQPMFEQEKGIKLTYNYASSGALQKQIEEGAPADIFISAGKKQMDALEDKKLIDKESRENLLSNKLVLIVPREYLDTIKTAADLIDKDVRISIGQPESVPAGQYAKDCLIYLNLWDKLNNKIVYAKDVKQVAAYVEAGEIAAGIVYNSDTAVLRNSIVAQVFEENSHKPIVYPGAIISASKNKSSAKVFLDYLNTDTAKQVFEKYKFNTSKK